MFLLPPSVAVFAAPGNFELCLFENGKADVSSRSFAAMSRGCRALPDASEDLEPVDFV